MVEVSMCYNYEFDLTWLERASFHGFLKISCLERDINHYGSFGVDYVGVGESLVNGINFYSCRIHLVYLVTSEDKSWDMGILVGLTTKLCFM